MFIRPAILEDLQNGLIDLLNDFVGVGETDDKKLEVHFLSASGIIFVMLDGYEVIGTATLIIDQKLIHLDKAGRVGRIEEVVIHEKYRGQGLGKQLVTHLVNEAKLLRCYKVILNCSPENEIFYERCGFYHVCNTMRIDLV